MQLFIFSRSCLHANVAVNVRPSAHPANSVVAACQQLRSLARRLGCGETAKVRRDLDNLDYEIPLTFDLVCTLCSDILVIYISYLLFLAGC